MSQTSNFFRDLITFIILMFVLIAINMVLFYPRKCTHLDKVRKLSINGVVIRKFYDKPNHGIRRVFGDKKELMFFSATEEEKAVYDSIMVGDSIYKKEQEIILYIQSKSRNKLLIISFDTIYNCEE